MNNKFQLIVFCILSFAIGIFVTYFYKKNPPPTSSKAVEVTNYVTTEHVSSNPTPGIHSSSIETHESEPAANFLEAKNKVSSMEKKIRRKMDELPIVSFGADGRKKDTYLIDSIKTKLQTFKNEKRVWFKGSFALDKGDRNYFYIFIHFSTTCYIKGATDCVFEDVYSSYNGKWEHMSLEDDFMSYFYVKNEIIYRSVSIDDFFPKLSEGLEVVRILFPMPWENAKAQYLRLKNEELGWIEGPEVTWLDVTEEEFKIFDRRVKRLEEN